MHSWKEPTYNPISDLSFFLVKKTCGSRQAVLAYCWLGAQRISLASRKVHLEQRPGRLGFKVSLSMQYCTTPPLSFLSASKAFGLSVSTSKKYVTDSLYFRVSELYNLSLRWHFNLALLLP